jgi:predicted ATPase
MDSFFHTYWRWNMLLKSFTYDHQPHGAYPFAIPAFAVLKEMHFTRPITIFAGENGSGKSTLLRGLAAKMNAVSIGQSQVYDDKLSPHLRLSWVYRTTRGFYLRSDDFLSFIERLQAMKQEAWGRN